jgi:hypothetical protein
MVVHGLYSWTVIAILRPPKSMFWDFQYSKELMKYLDYFRFKDITIAYMCGLIALGHLFILLNSIYTEASVIRIIISLFLIISSIGMIAYQVNLIKKEYPDRSELLSDLKLYITYKLHSYYLNGDDIM